MGRGQRSRLFGRDESRCKTHFFVAVKKCTPISVYNCAVLKPICDKWNPGSAVALRVKWCMRSLRAEIPITNKISSNATTVRFHYELYNCRNLDVSYIIIIKQCLWDQSHLYIKLPKRYRNRYHNHESCYRRAEFLALASSTSGELLIPVDCEEDKTVRLL